jgi:hypothetical protein
MQDFLNISYLKKGTDRQKHVYKVLQQLNILQILRDYKPTLIGSIALNLDLSNSDVDLCCQYSDKECFKGSLIENYNSETSFELLEYVIYDVEAVVCNFSIGGFQIEIFGQNILINQQMGYKLMMIEDELLHKYGEIFRKEIIQLKREGLKTEEAFGKLLGLSGNPYLSLLNYNINC